MGSSSRLLGGVRRDCLAGFHPGTDLPNEQEEAQDARKDAQAGMPDLCSQHIGQANSTAATVADRLVQVQPLRARFLALSLEQPPKATPALTRGKQYYFPSPSPSASAPFSAACACGLN